MAEKPEEQEPVDLEEFAKAGKPVPSNCKLFRIRIDGEKYLVQQAALSGRELLKIADKDPDGFAVFFRMCNGKTHEVGLNVHFSFLDPGIERFITRERKCGETNVTIIVNTNPKKVPGPTISFEDVIKLAFPDLVGKPMVFFTVTYKDGCPPKPKGDLTSGQRLNVKEGMVFRVTATDKS